ncbi:unnamed protein product [Hydatigera taeniaeformis]|uniref:C2H2-type domain-containing protein n=1 Tax=Hydatigena taeniaeformis TaxID=6205 RepID=A0A0R3X9R5_HYDTA|nr:unnamed protein product [Hydatigera taeniaeformis]
MDGRKDVVGATDTATVTTAEAGRMPQFTCPYCQRLYVSLTYFRKHLAAHAPSHSTTTTVSSTATGAVATKSALTTDCSSGSTADFCEVFTEEVSLGCDLGQKISLQQGSLRSAVNRTVMAMHLIYVTSVCGHPD